MDKPKPLQNNVSHTNVSKKNLDTLKHQNAFVMASHSAYALQQEVVQKMTTLANFGVTFKSRAQRCIGIVYKVSPAGSREALRRLRQQQRLATRKKSSIPL